MARRRLPARGLLSDLRCWRSARAASEPARRSSEPFGITEQPFSDPSLCLASCCAPGLDMAACRTTRGNGRRPARAARNNNRVPPQPEPPTSSLGPHFKRLGPESMRTAKFAVSHRPLALMSNPSLPTLGHAILILLYGTCHNPNLRIHFYCRPQAKCYPILVIESGFHISVCDGPGKCSLRRPHKTLDDKRVQSKHFE